ncbi:type VI secretion system protein TssA [Arcobacter sp. CECT 8986]|uniref:type VI secretion system protein TssA n=1 Tax=Arcobacter sp. CECT 8986 TaxID=2044507 RepID=UPI0013E94BDC|nr:type VI secretion system protein TssA [Arcobacter sp. CECT 8986]
MYNSILNQIDDKSIVGEDFKYNDSFLLIEQEIDKTHSAQFDGTTDWEFVLNNSYELLNTKSKDLKIATWWIYSIWKKDSFFGLEKNLEIYIDFIKSFNENLYPKSLKAKTNTIAWFDETITNELINHNFQDKVNQINFLEYFKQLCIVYNQILNNDEKYFKKVIKVLSEKIAQDEQSKIEHQKKQEDKKEEPQQLDSISESTVSSSLSLLKKTATNLSSYYRQKDFADLKSIKITRFLSWLEVDELPINENGITPLNPPSILEIDELKQLFNEKKYEEALILCEEIIQMCPFWLDGHYYSFKILEAIDKQYISKEVQNQFISYIKTNNGLLNLSFQDKTPFASAKTKSWIKKELETNENSDSTTNQNDELDLEEISDLKEAMKKIEEMYSQSKSEKDKFLLRIKHLEIAINFNKDDISLALFDELNKNIKKFNLVEWNPKIVSKVYSLVLNYFTSVQIKREKLEKMYAVLCKIDIDKALEININ